MVQRSSLSPRSYGVGTCFGPSRERPLGPTILQAPSAPPRGLKATDGLVRVGAERATAIRDDLPARRQLGQAVLELPDGDGLRALDVPRLELLVRANVNQNHVALAHPGDQLIAADRVHLFSQVVARG